MGRLPDEWIDCIKTDIPIRELVEAAGIELKRQGGNWVGLCPFHDDESVDEQGLRAYTRELAAVEGIMGLVANGHTGEIMSLRDAERA